ncbi:alcohol dehydrogenase catalytic domain-containing protein [Methanosarcina horonobensis]|uniref:alcohol dehydrogenase catalytic domain-containing protein n=1 Tax=Methanosarcina horonobensis TaxID=418008 RepID=UPI0022B9321C|nr:alcohol dehydrogenase catalytic domain-containing protein [Methanosarcina horonobensis]
MEDPKIEHPADAIVRLTSSGICGSDLHMYEGRTVEKPGKVLGHEPLGVIEEVGDAVFSFKKRRSGGYYFQHRLRTLSELYSGLYKCLPDR